MLVVQAVRRDMRSRSMMIAAELLRKIWVRAKKKDKKEGKEKQQRAEEAVYVY